MHNKKEIKEIPFYLPSIGEEEKKCVDEMIDQHPILKVDELEVALANFVGSHYAVATNNTTSAIHLALSSIDLKRGDKVLMSVNCFADIPETVRHFDAEPIFVDINPVDMNIDLDQFEQILENNTNKKLRVAIITFIAGQTTDLERLYAIVKKHNIILIEDATSALGATYKDETIGSLSADMTIFSFNPSHDLHKLFDGGGITTNNEQLYKKAKKLKNHAIQITTNSSGAVDYFYDVADIGFKYDITQIGAALCIIQLNKTNKFIKRRKEIAKIYMTKLANTKHIELLVPNEEHIFTQFLIKISKNRDAFARALKEVGIATNLHYVPLHLLSYYKHKYNLKVTLFPNALNAYQQVLSLPIYPSLSDEDVEYICDEIIRIAHDWI